MDGTFFECSLIRQPKSKHFVLFAIDTANNELVLAKAFYSKNGSNSCTANQVIKALQPPIERAKLTNDLIIHTEYLFVSFRIFSYLFVSFRIFSYLFVSFRIFSYLFVSFRIFSYLFVSFRIFSYLFVSFRIFSYLFVSFRIFSYLFVSFRIFSYLFVSFRIFSYLFVSFRIFSYLFVSFRIFSYLFVSFRIFSYLFVVGVFHLIFIMILLKPFVIGSMTDGVSKRCRRENSSFQQKSIQKYSSRMAKKGIRN